MLNFSSYFCESFGTSSIVRCQTVSATGSRHQSVLTGLVCIDPYWRRQEHRATPVYRSFVVHKPWPYRKRQIFHKNVTVIFPDMRTLAYNVSKNIVPRFLKPLMCGRQVLHSLVLSHFGDALPRICNVLPNNDLSSFCQLLNTFVCN